jgi:iron(III) transport system substrate-binding protein
MPMLSRRTLLRALGMSAAAIVLAACGTNSPVTTSTIAGSTPTTGTRTLGGTPTSVAANPSSAATTPTSAATAAATGAATPAATAVATPAAMSTPPPIAASGSFTLYTSEPQDLVNEMKADFEKHVSGVTMNIFRSGSGPVVAKLQAEEQAGGIQADLIWFADIAFFNSLADKDLLLTYTPPEAAALPTQYVYRDGRFYEVRLIFNIVGINTTAVTGKPTSWTVLTDPKYKGRVGIASPLYSGAALSTLGTLVTKTNLGWGYYEKLKANNVVVEQSNGTLANKLASGEYAGVSVVDFTIRAAKQAGSPVEEVWPEEGAVLVPTPIAIIKNSKNQDAAKAFLRYLLSKDGQQLFVKQNYVPVVPSVPGPQGVPPLDQLKVIPTAEDYIAKNRKDLTDHFESIFGK